MDSEVERQVRSVAVGRVALGTAFLMFPGTVLRGWLGRGANDPATRLVARSAGGRDIALGLGTLFALRHGASVRGWLEASMVADASDAVAALLGSRDLPRLRSLGAALAGAATVAYSRRLVNELPGADAAQGTTVP